MVRKPLLKNDNRTKLFFYDYFIIHHLCGGLQDLRTNLSYPSPNNCRKGLLVLDHIQPSRTLSNDNATRLVGFW